MSLSNARKFTIEKLSNYRIWKARLELLFKYNKLWDMILGSSTKPEKEEDREEYKEKIGYKSIDQLILLLS